MELFSKRRWAADEAQQSNNHGIMPCMCCIIFFGFNIIPTAFSSGQYSLHLLQLKSSMNKAIGVKSTVEIINKNPTTQRYDKYVRALKAWAKLQVKKYRGNDCLKSSEQTWLVLDGMEQMTNRCLHHFTTSLVLHKQKLSIMLSLFWSPCPNVFQLDHVQPKFVNFAEMLHASLRRKGVQPDGGRERLFERLQRRGRRVRR